MSQRSPGDDTQLMNALPVKSPLASPQSSDGVPFDEKPAGREIGEEFGAPPHYESVFGHLKEGQDGKKHKIKKLSEKIYHAFAGTVSTIFLLVIVLALPVAMIVIGAKYKSQCPVEPFIPIYLIVGGSFAIVKSLFVLCQRATVGDLANLEPGDDQQPIIGRLIDNVLNLFLFIWFVAGNIWVYSNYKPNSIAPAHQPNNYCHPTLYYFAFWVITTSYILMAVIVFCICCLGFCASCTAYFITNAA